MTNRFRALVALGGATLLACADGSPDDTSRATAQASEIPQQGLLVWLDAMDPNGDGSEVANNTQLSAWVDKAQRRAVVQATASRRPVFRTAAIGNKPAVFFDGVDDFLDIAANIDAAALPDVTVVAVIQNQAGTTSTFAGVWGQDNDGYDRFLSSGGGSGVSNGNSFTNVAGLTAEGTRLVVTTTLRAGVSNGSTVYVNGTLGATFSSTPRPGTTNMRLGNLRGDAATANHGFDGYVAELLVYDRALSADERTALDAQLQAKWSLPLPLTVAPGATHAYLFDQSATPTANIARDEALGFGVGEPETAPGFFGAGASWQPHGDGQAVALSGGPDSYVRHLYEVGKFGTGDFTVVFDFAGTYTGRLADLVSNRDTISHGNFFNIRMRGPQHELGGNGRVFVEVDQDTTGKNYNSVEGGAINDGQWHRVAAVRRGKELSLAIDGVVVASRMGPGIANLVTYSSSGYGYNDLLLGARTTELAPRGTFDNLTFYDRALTAAELAGIDEPIAHHEFDAAPVAWTNLSGAWTWDGPKVTAQSLTVAPGTAGAVTWLRGSSFSDVAVETRIKLNGAGTGDAGIMLRGINFSAINDRGQQYHIGLNQQIGVIVGKLDNGWTELGRAPVTITPDTYYTLRVEAIGTNLFVYVDGVLKLTINDGSHASGGIALRSYMRGATYDYVRITHDLARGKPTTQSTTDYGGVSSRAVDGNANTAWASGSITHTRAETGQGWQVDLGAISSVTHLTVWSRAANDCSSCASRLKDYLVKTSTDGAQWTEHPYPGTVPERLVVPIQGPVRYVQIDQTSNTAEHFSLAEVAAWGTPCRPDEIAEANGRCTACPEGLVTTDGATCVSPRPLVSFSGADYMSRLIAVGSGMCMVAAGTGTVHQRPCTRHTVGWFLDVIDPAATVKSYALRTGNRCLVADAPTDDGTATVRATAGCGDGSSWLIEWNADGQLRLRNEQRDVCLAIDAHDTNDGALVVGVPCTGESRQLWKPDTLRSRSFNSPLQAMHSGRCLQLAAGQPAQQQDCQDNPTSVQNLQITNLGDGSFLIAGDNGTRCLAVQSVYEGSQLGSSSCTGLTTERWAMVPLDGGGLSLVSLYTGYCAEIPDAQTANGVVAVQRQCNGSNHQRFEQIRIGGSIPLRVTLEEIGSEAGTALVVSGEHGAYVTRDAIAIKHLTRANTADLRPLLNADQQADLDVWVEPQGLETAIVRLEWYKVNGDYDVDLGPFSHSGTFTIKPGLSLVSGSDSVGDATIDWKVNLKGQVGITGLHYDTPIGRIGGSYRTDIFSGTASGTIELGSITLEASVGIDGVTYTGPGDEFYDEYLADYVNIFGMGRHQWMARALMDAFTASSKWGPYAYAKASTAIADFARDFADAIADGYGAVAGGVGTAIEGVENFFGSVGSKFKDAFEDLF